MAQVLGGVLSRALRRREQTFLITASALFVAITALAPLVQILVQAAAGWPSGLAVLASAQTWTLLLRSVALGAAVSTVALAIGMPLGVLVGRCDVPLRRTLWLVHAFPMLLPPFLPALGWFHLLGRDGLVGGHTSARLLFSELGLVVVLALTFAPVVTSLTAIGVMGVDSSLEEAGRAVAGPFRVATRILLPAALPASGLAAVIVFALAFSELGVPMLLRVDVFPAAVFTRLGGVDFAPGEAFALTLPLVPVALGLLALERRFAGQRSFAVLGLRGAGRKPLPLRQWRTAAAASCGGAALVSAAPLFALVLRSGGEGGGVGALFEWAGQAPYNGLVAGAAAATLIASAGLVLGHAAARGRRIAAVVDAVAMLAFVTPAAVLGTGLIAFWNRASTQIVYGTLAILAVGYVARYIVVGVRVVASAVAQSPVHLEEAAAASGAWFTRRLARIVLPLHARGVAFAWLLALVFCLRDLETAVLFYPPGREPLTVRIFTLEANGPPAIVAGLSALHVGIVAVIVAAGVLLLRRRRV
jgi:iron(III) transport system permease protein